MKKKDLQAIAQAAAKNIKTEEDLSEFRQMLTKITVKTALNAELDDHLGFDKHEQTESDNSRNGVTHKTLQTEDGQFELATPRDRSGSFEPQLVKKHQRRFTSMDDKILFLYAQGMSTREIVRTFKEMYGADASPALISKVTDAVIEEVVEWQSRPLEAVYPIVYLDCIVVKIRQDKRVINKAVYLALGVNMEGHKELLGLWLAENEGAKFWLNVLTELQNRGVRDILLISTHCSTTPRISEKRSTRPTPSNRSTASFARPSRNENCFQRTTLRRKSSTWQYGTHPSDGPCPSATGSSH